MVIRVGIVGLSKTGSWAENAHITPLKSLTGSYKLTALSTSRAESAEEASKEWGVKGYHGSTSSIASDSNVDLVVISVRVPAHKNAVMPVIEAGKDVFCEWPLGLNLKEAEEIRDAAKAKGVRTMVGLQARQGFAVNRAKGLIKEGAIGKVLSTNVIGNGAAWGAISDERNQYLLDNKNGATMLTIPFSHMLDAFNYVLGDFTSLSAQLSTVRPKVHVGSLDGPEVSMTSPDQIAVFGALKDGAVADLHFRGGMGFKEQGGEDFRWEIQGDAGFIEMKGMSGHIQIYPTTISLNGKGIDLPEDKLGNVGREYEAFAKGDTANYVDFDHAVERHRIIDAIERSAKEGKRVEL